MREIKLTAAAIIAGLLAGPAGGALATLIAQPAQADWVHVGTVDVWDSVLRQPDGQRDVAERTGWVYRFDCRNRTVTLMFADPYEHRPVPNIAAWPINGGFVPLFTFACESGKPA
jgi:hypothetical protein